MSEARVNVNLGVLLNGRAHAALSETGISDKLCNWLRCEPGPEPEAQDSETFFSLSLSFVREKRGVAKTREIYRRILETMRLGECNRIFFLFFNKYTHCVNRARGSLSELKSQCKHRQQSPLVVGHSKK